MASDSDMNAEMDRLAAEAGIGEMTSSAIGLHEMYSDFVKAGFTPRQALYLIGFSINPNGARPPAGDDAD